MHWPLRIAMQQLFNNNNNNRARAHSHKQTIKLAHTHIHTNTSSVTFLGLRLGQHIKRNDARTAHKKSKITFCVRFSFRIGIDDDDEIFSIEKYCGSSCIGFSFGTHVPLKSRCMLSVARMDRSFRARV